METNNNTAAEQIIPAFLRAGAPPAQYAYWNDGHLLIRIGETTLTLTPDDIRRLEKFMGTFTGEAS